MKLIFFIIFLIHKTSLHPVQNDRIVFPDELKNSTQIENSDEDLEFNPKSLLNDPNILKPDNVSTELLLDLNEEENLENGEYFQGDIVLTEDQLKHINDTSDMSIRTGIKSVNFRWPKDNSGKVIVPYRISSEFSATDESRIMTAISSIEKHTCIRFQKQNSQKDYLKIESVNGCHSSIGKISGPQTVSLKRTGCLKNGIIIHELMHALGFRHMHAHVDRDKYIKINWENIKASEKSNFFVVTANKYDNFGTAYDYHSVMHYGANTFSMNRKSTIVPVKSKYKKIIGQRIGLSKGDKARLNAMYNCDV